MQTISKLSDECKKCPHVDDCDNKRMEACSMMEWKPQINIPNNINGQAMQINNNIVIIDVGKHENNSAKEIIEKLEKDIYRSLGCPFTK